MDTLNVLLLYLYNRGNPSDSKLRNGLAVNTTLAGRHQLNHRAAEQN